MHTTTTLLPACTIGCEDDEPTPEGLYGPAHWLDDRGIATLLTPYLCDGWDLGDYARFADLTGTDARRLASLLPKDARDDRQNNAPRIIDLLRAASRIDGLSLEGYVPESAIIAHTGAPIDDERYPSYQHWLTLATVLGLGEEAIPPDEMRLLVRDGSSMRWWWAWWD